MNEGSTITFSIKNFGFNVNGSFSGLEGSIHFDPIHLDASSFDLSIAANSVNTGSHLRDNHLREQDYFDEKNFPGIHFQSTQVEPPAQAGNYLAYGRLTVKNQCRDISIPFSATSSDVDYLFNGRFKMNRKDFAIDWSSTISDNLERSLNLMVKSIKK